MVFSGTLCKSCLGRCLMCCIYHASLESSAAVQKGHVHVGVGVFKRQGSLINQWTCKEIEESLAMTLKPIRSFRLRRLTQQVGTQHQST